MRNVFLRPLVAVTLALLGGCSATRLAPQSGLPPPLIERVPARVGIYYPKEFREFVHKETRAQVDYEITLGPAHVQNFEWLLKAMFTEIVPVQDPHLALDMRPPLTMVLEPKFEEYSFLTPRDVAGDAFIVTIRYLLTVYDGTGGRVDAFTLTGYGREPARALGSAEPLKIATQRAMRDAGAKVAVELVDQDSVRLLLRGQPEPLPPPSVPTTQSPQSASPTGEPPPAGPPQDGAPPAAAPAAETPAEESPAEEAPAAESPEAEPPGAEAPGTETPEAATPAAATPPDSGPGG